MCRSFLAESIPAATLTGIVELGLQAPSAGHAQGLRLVLLEGSDRDDFWDLTLPSERRAGFRWQGLLVAPTLLLVFADPQAYVSRYSEPDKRRTGLGDSIEAWTTPYWTVDAGMAVMAMLLGAEDRGLGALFFALAHGESEVRERFLVDECFQTIGVIALGRPDVDDPDALGSGRSSERPRVRADQIMRRGSGRPERAIFPAVE
jgi:nitroreductase